MTTVKDEPRRFGVVLAGSAPATIHPVWRTALPVTVAVVAGVLLALADSAASMVGVWASSETFAHGFLILPISGYLVWRQRHRVLALVPRPEPLALMLVGGAALLWLVGRFAAVQVIEHLALVLVIQSAVFALLGRRVTLALLFPLAYLLFAVPMGQSLVPPLQDFTADFAVRALRMVGVPVFHDGLYIAIPNGNFLVAEACSGVRYLIASLALGVLFAGITYRSWTRRAVFVALSLLVPIVANGIRAFGIIYLAYVSDNRIAIGVDHILYGWLFFALVIFVLLAIGMRFHETETETAHAVADPASERTSWRAFAGVGAVALAVTAGAPSFAAYAEAREAAPTVEVAAPEASPPWEAAAREPAWRPRFPGASLVLSQAYARDATTAELHVVYFARQGPGAELVNSENSLAGEGWQLAGSSAAAVRIGGRERVVTVARYTLGGRRRTAWYWYWVDGATTADAYVAKWLEVRGKLAGRSPAAALIGVVTDETGIDEVAPVLESLLTSLPTVDELPARIAGESG